jgi:predicted ATPase
VLTAVAIANYRSLRNVIVPMQQLNVVTAANGSGKSSFYRALRLLGDTAQGRIIQSLAREGGCSRPFGRVRKASRVGSEAGACG